MSYYIQTLLTGFLTAALIFWMMEKESDRRYYHYVQRFHTYFVVLDADYRKSLHRTHYIIGRRKRRCDICLDMLKDDSIGKVHAILWYDGRNFCIAPGRDLSFFLSRKEAGKPLPAIYVNGELVPETGAVVGYGDRIRMGNSYFQLENGK